MDFTSHIKHLLGYGKELISNNPGMNEETGNINTKGDKTIVMDAKIETLFLNYIKENKLPVKVFSEEIGIVDTHPSPEYIMAFDPLDGSTNYRVGNNLYPYGFLIAVYKGLNPQIKDVVAAGALEITHNMGFIFNGTETQSINGEKIILKQDWPLTLSTPIYLDLYRKTYYDGYSSLAEKLYIRNTGSTVGNISFVLANVASGMGHPKIKAEEIGAIYGLIKGAQGEVVDHQGDDLGNSLFNFSGNYQLIAGAKNITGYMVENILR
jgi:fructose-1,6-bisphosphatase/inositol monophosphatase family enzyme